MAPSGMVAPLVVRVRGADSMARPVIVGLPTAKTAEAPIWTAFAGHLVLRASCRHNCRSVSTPQSEIAALQSVTAVPNWVARRGFGGVVSWFLEIFKAVAGVRRLPYSVMKRPYKFKESTRVSVAAI